MTEVSYKKIHTRKIGLAPQIDGLMEFILIIIVRFSANMQFLFCVYFSL